MTALLLAPPFTTAQTTTQVTISGIPPILPTPFLSDFEQNVSNGTYHVQLNVVSSGNQPVELEFQGRITKDGVTLSEEVSHPVSFEPGFHLLSPFYEFIRFPVTTNEVISDLTDNLLEQAIQTGAFPEGSYTITLEPRLAGTNTPLGAPGIATFMVRYPQPPVLLTPNNLASIHVRSPVFSWTPVMAPPGVSVEYDFILVELFDDQHPGDAILSNREHASAELFESTTMPYTGDLLPLEEGRHYAWQIIARDANDEIPIKNNGESEIFTFTYGDEPARPVAGLDELEEITLVPGFATLTNLADVSVTEQEEQYELSGPATLRLEFAFTDAAETTVNLNNLLIQKQSLSNPVLMGGSVRGAAGEISGILSELNEWVELDELSWNFGGNVIASAAIRIPGQESFEASGDLVMNQTGVSGTIEAEGDPIVQYSGGELQIDLTSVGISFPENRVWADGDAAIFGTDVPCELTNFAPESTSLAASLECIDSFSVPLVDDHDALRLQVDDVSGTVNIDAETGNFGFDVNLRSSAGLLTTAGQYCGSRMLLGLSSDAGFNIQPSGISCPIPEPEIDLGFARLQFSNTELTELDYDAATGTWDFELGLDSKLTVPAFESWSSVTISGIRVSPAGIDFEAFDFDDEIISLPSFDAQLLQVALETFRMNDFTFPLFEWDEQAPGPWDIEFAGGATIQSGTGVPSCLVASSLSLTDGQITQNRAEGFLELADFDGCVWEFGPGYGLHFNAISGRAGVEYPSSDEIRPFGELELDGGISLGAPFTCEGDEQEMLTFSGDELTFSDGIHGTLENIKPSCPVQIGPFTAQVTGSSIQFDRSNDGEQQAVMAAAATIMLPNGIEVNGSLELNLFTGRFLDLSFSINEPFDWHIPNENNPVLTFRLDRAELSENGFFIDDSHTFVLPGSETDVTFDNLLLDLTSLRVQSGRVKLDSNFGFEVGFAQDNFSDLAFRAVDENADLSLDAGIVMNMGGEVVIDSSGVHTSGTAGAKLIVGEHDLSSIDVDYSDEFSMSLYPFGIQSGKADFLLNDDRFATVDESGFRLVGDFITGLIPEQLPLPHKDIAYLQLRDGDNFLVDFTENETGDFVLSTAAGSPISLVLPYLDGISLDVEFEDLVIGRNLSSPKVKAGSVRVDVPDGLADLTEKAIPLALQTIEFGERMIDGDPVQALFLEGNLTLFDGQEIDDENNKAAFYLSGADRVRADFNLTGMDSRFSIAPDDWVVVGVDAIRGDFSMQIGSGSPDFNFEIDGNLEVGPGEDTHAGAGLTIRTSNNRPVQIINFEGLEFDDPLQIGFGSFGLAVEEIVDIRKFGFSSEDGFEFAVALDLNLGISLSDGELAFPLNGVEIRHNGIHFPELNINDGAIPGLDLPEINLGGLAFKPLALITPGAFTWEWSDGPSLEGLNPMLDFSVKLPEDLGGLNPPDGLMFTGVGFQDGYLTGKMEFDFSEHDGVKIPIAPGGNAPQLVVNQISGALSPDENASRQSVDLEIEGLIGNLPAFDVEENEECSDSEFTFRIVEARAFEGTVSNLQPCGTLALGPVALRVTGADLELSLDGDEQSAVLDGGVQVTLPSPGEESTPPEISGELEIDIISGEIRGGQVEITEPFALNMPFAADDPLFAFQIEQARLDALGLTLSGGGHLEKAGVNASVTFDELLIDLREFSVLDGSATIASDFAVQFSIAPFGFQLVDSQSGMPSDVSGLRMDLDAEVTLDPDGLNFAGAADANLLYSGEQFGGLRVELEDNFAMSISSLRVNRGKAEFYWDQDGQTAQEPLAWIDENGFGFGGGLIALLPDRIPLPSEEIAYIDIKDSDGEPLVEYEAAENGHQLRTREGESLEIYVPALADGSGTPLSVAVSFALHTDDAFNITGGDISLDTNVNLEERLGLPVSLTNFDLDDEDILKLQVGLSFELPAVFDTEEQETELFATLSASGIEAGSFSIGNVPASYDPAHDPVFIFNPFDDDQFTTGLLGVEAQFGESNSVMLAGTMQSSLIMQEDSTPLFFTAGWSNSQWEFDLDPGDALDDALRLGQTAFKLDDHNPLSITADSRAFYVSMNGQISFEEILEEPVTITVKGLEVGVDQLDSGPVLHTGLDEATGDLGVQEFSLFEILDITMNNPSIELVQEESLAIAIASDGQLAFLDQEIDFEGLRITTAGDFTLDEVKALDVEIIGEYLVLQSLDFSFEENFRLESELKLSLPAPAEEFETDATLAVYRDETGIQVDTDSLEFDDLEADFELAGFGAFHLTRVRADIDPFKPQKSGVYTNAHVKIPTEDDPVIKFGKSNGFPDNAGIGIGFDGNVTYNITGNEQFDLDFNFFEIRIEADLAGGSENDFEIRLGGEADVAVAGINANLEYEGIRITSEGVADRGRLDGNGSIDIGGIASATIGAFDHREFEGGASIEIAATGEKSPEDLQSDTDNGGSQVETTTVDNVTQVLCFGGCPVDGMGSDGSALEFSIGADFNNNSGGFGGGVESVFFYEKSNNQRYLAVEGVRIEIDTIFEMTASLNYQREDGEFLLRAAATGAFTAGPVNVSAMVAGKFSKIDNQTSYGLFAAVGSNEGIPIVPGVVNLTGAGAGFFYNPDPADLDMVHTSLGVFGHKLVQKDAIQIQENTDFAAMLFASANVGPGSTSIVKGSAYLQITNQSFYLDARGALLEMGEGSLAQTEAEMFARFQQTTDEEEGTTTSAAAEISVELEVSPVLKGGAEIEFYLVNRPEETVWGIVGEVDLDIFDVLSGKAEFLAGTPGLMLTVTLEADFDVLILSVETSVTGSVWVLSDDGADYPFGAYMTFEASAKFLWGLAGASVEATAAFVSQSPGYMLFASLGGCGEILYVVSKCITGWASYSSEDGMDYGTGSGNEHFLNEIQQQQDLFTNRIEELREQVATALEVLQNPPLTELAPTEEDVADAGFNFYNLSSNIRNSWVNFEIERFELESSTVLPYTTPQPLQDVLDIMRDVHVNPILYTRDSFSIILTLAYHNVEDAYETIEEDIFSAFEIQEDTRQLFDNMLDELAESPVLSVIRVQPSTEADQSIHFEIDEGRAERQIASMEEFSAEVVAMKVQFRANIDSASVNLDAMDELLSVRSLNRITQFYLQLIQGFEQHYASEVQDALGRIWWAGELQGRMREIEGEISDAINTLTNHNTRARFSLLKRPLESAAYRIAQRQHFIAIMASKSFGNRPIPSPDASDFNYIRELYEQLQQRSQFNIQEIEELNRRFWWDMHIDGLSQLMSHDISDYLRELNDDYNKFKDEVFGPLAEITHSVDEFFTIRGNVTAILYNMVDQYLEWQEMVESGDTGDTAYTNLRDQLSDELQPPQITEITVYPEWEDGMHFNRTDIQWRASHPVGVIENSIQYHYGGQDDSNIEAFQDQYLTVGNRDKITLMPSSIRFRNTRNVNFGVRVRGPAGNTAIRRASFEVDVAPGGSTTPPGTQVLPDPDDISPPPPPVINLSGNYPFTKTPVLFSFDGASEGGETTYWTSDPSHFDLVVEGHDPEVGIGAWEYAIGTEPGADDVAEWTRLEGRREFLPEIPAHRMSGPTRFLNLEPGVEYYISARVENMAGQMSPPAVMEEPVIYDPEPPAGITLDRVIPEPHRDQLAFISGTLPVYEPIETVPPFSPSDDEVDAWTSPANPRLVFSNIRADDPYSGVDYFEYVLSQEPDPPHDRFAADEADIHHQNSSGLGSVLSSGQLTITGRNISPGDSFGDSFFTGFRPPALDSYNREVWLHMRGVDVAGNIGEIYTFGPYTAVDQTRPEPGRLQAHVVGDHISLYVTEAPYDPESGLLGVQYAVGTSVSDMESFRAFPGGSTIDLEWNEQISKTLAGLPVNGTSGLPDLSDIQRYITIPAEELPDVGETFYLYYRSVNTKGMYSLLRATGPLNLDTTPPEQPVIQASRFSSDGRIYMDINNITDPESGIKKIEYWVDSRRSDPWAWYSLDPTKMYRDVSTTEVQEHDGVKHGTFDLRIVSPPVPDSINHRITVRLTNGAGLTTTETVTIR